ncbi:MAG: ribonuclease P protein component [Hyphomicrobiales bacterium]
MKKRAAFLNAAKGVFMPRKSFVMQRNEQSDASDETDSSLLDPRVGFTVTKKVGNAVIRNRVRRRMREAVRVTSSELFQNGHDYVLVGRKEALSVEFNTLCADIESTLKRLARGEGKPARPYKSRTARSHQKQTTSDTDRTTRAHAG